MPDISEVLASTVGIGGVLVALLTAALAYFKPKPGDETRLEMEREKSGVELAQVNLNIAQETVEFVTETLESQVRRVLADQTALRQDWDQYRLDSDARQAELSTALRAEKAKNQQLTFENQRLKVQVEENEQLKARITQLENEVRRLKANQPNSNPEGGAVP